MRLPKWLHRMAVLQSPPSPAVCPKLQLAEAKERRREAYARRPEVEELASRLDEERRRNHFGETVDTIYRRRHA